MNKSIKKFAEEHISELISDIKEMCAIPSVLSEPADGAPFGEDCLKALQKGKSLCEKYGFVTRDYDNYCVAADLDPSLVRHLDILGHTDVVPAGEGWRVTTPFEVVERDGALYGRGVSDDKGPLLCALYAMRAIKESGIQLKKGVRLILGSDEETGSTDIKKYYALEPEAAFTFSPDAAFPLINIEKGMFRGTLRASAPVSGKGLELVSLKAGIATNAVPGKATLVFSGADPATLSSACQKLSEEIPVQCQIDGDTVTVKGESAHASTPHHGVNAGIAGLTLLKYLDVPNDRRHSLLKKVTELFPYAVFDGSGIGISMTDEHSLSLTCTLDIFSVDRDGMEFTFDSRTSLNANEDNCLAVARKNIEAAGFSFESPGLVPPHYVPEDSDFVKKLLKAYEDVTGLPGKAIGVGGGTYVHDIKNGVAFGAVLPGIDTRMHGADEFMGIENLKIAVEVYAEAILAVCG